MRSTREASTQTTCDCENCPSYALTMHLQRSADQAARHHQDLARDGWTDVEGRNYCPGCPMNRPEGEHDHAGAWAAAESDPRSQVGPARRQRERDQPQHPTPKEQHMPITATYQVRCDVCFGHMDGEYETRDDAQDARKELGWDDPNGGTACPEHNTRPSA